MLKLLEVHCISILTYAIDVIHVANLAGYRWPTTLSSREFTNYKPWESFTELQHALQRPTWEELVNKRQAKFRDRISQCDFLRNFT